MSTYPANWIELEGAVNVRDVGGLPTTDGRAVRPGVLIRSANLQHLTGGDVSHLVDELGVRRVVDLRTDVEVATEVPGPMHSQPSVTVHHLSLYPDDGNGELQPVPDALLPWHREKITGNRDPAVTSYLRYLHRRPDSILAALRAIAQPDGATLVHCAAGKDRTGMVVALALLTVGVDRQAVAEDYAHTQSQLHAIMAHLARSTMYSREVADPEKVPPASAQFMLDVLSAIDEDLGGVPAWLAQQGWTRSDTEQLRETLLGGAELSPATAG